MKQNNLYTRALMLEQLAKNSDGQMTEAIAESLADVLIDLTTLDIEVGSNKTKMEVWHLVAPVLAKFGLRLDEALEDVQAVNNLLQEILETEGVTAFEEIAAGQLLTFKTAELYLAKKHPDAK